MARVERTERLLNLVFALLASRRAVPRDAIRAGVPGYDDAPSEAAFERMFERDKDELRSMGIPIETVLDLDGDAEGYRITREAYDMPDLQCSAAELAVLGLAASVWDDAILGPAARTALRKIEAVEGEVASPVVEGLRVQVSSHDAALLPLMHALRECRSVTFAYQAVGAEVTKRQVDPWGLVCEQGHWYLAAWDADRSAPRVFRLSRIQGQVTVTARAQAHPLDGTDVAALVRGQAAAPTEPVVVWVESGRAAGLRRMASSRLEPFEAGEIALPDTGPRLVAAACAAGAGARVLAPASVRDEVIVSLTRVLERHA